MKIEDYNNKIKSILHQLNFKVDDIATRLLSENDIIIKYDKKNDYVKIYSTLVEKI
jgi:hypothetical protein